MTPPAKRATGGRSTVRSAGGSPGPAAEGPVRIGARHLRWTCPPLKPSGKPPTAAFLLGQDRAMAALRTGLSIHAPGYNLFVSGLMGSGRTAVVELLLRDIQPVCRRVPDRVFVPNFREPNRPLLVSLPPGRANAFRDELQDLGRSLHHALQAALRSRPHRMSRRVVKRASGGRERRIMDALQRQAAKQNCALVRFQAQNGASTADIYPVVDGEPITVDALSALVIEGKVGEDHRGLLLRQREQLLERLDEVNERMQEEQQRIAGELRTMDRQLAWKVLQTHTREFQRRWPEPAVADWLDAAGEFVERHLQQFVALDLEPSEPDEEGEAPEAAPPLGEQRFAEFDARVVKTSINDACAIWLNVIALA